jgi:hypothetical protein
MPAILFSIRQPWGRMCLAWPNVFLASLLLVVHTGLDAQKELSLDELKEKAAKAFEDKTWEEAHRAYAELLSLDGTNVQLQMRYAATLLHDDRLRLEGIQRMASLAERDALQGEGMYWWGRSWMLQGRPEQASAAFERALEQAEKKSIWRSECQRALDQCKKLPTEFREVQRLQKLDVVEVPLASFHRYVRWADEGVRLMSVPQELQSKRDKKAGVKASVALRRNSREVLFHSLGSKGEQGLDIWVATLNEKGQFDKPIRLPNEVNSAYDEIHPVWDESTQCLTFASNRPGTLGGMDIFQSCKEHGAWTDAKALGPSFNSVHDDLAYYPCVGDEINGWLVTTRSGEFGAVEVWEVTLDGLPIKPLQLKSSWDMGDEALPGTLTLFDAQTDQTLAKVELQQGRGQWDLVVSSGQVIHYRYETTEGIHVEGTYALPESDGTTRVDQQMTWSPSSNDLTVTTQLSPQLSESKLTDEPISWGWDVVLDDIPTLAAEEWAEPDVDEVAQLEVKQTESSEKRIVKFQSYPWWTELQKEERDIAASILTEHVSNPAKSWPEAKEYDDPASYMSAIESLGLDAQSQILQTIVSRAAADVIMEDDAFDDALQGVLDLGAEYWQAIGWPRAELERKASRIWAEAGVRFDKGLVANVRDKRGLVGDRSWIDGSWNDGTLVGHLNNATWSQKVDPEAAALAWSLAKQSGRMQEMTSTESTDWMDVRFWQASSIPDESAVAASSGNGDAPLEDSIGATLQLRMALLDEIEASPEFDIEAIARARSKWQSIAIPILGDGKAAEDPEMGLESTAGVEGSSSNTDLSSGLQDAWNVHWSRFLASGQASSGDLPLWRREMLKWLEQTLEEESLPQPLLERCFSRQATGFASAEKVLDPGRGALDEVILAMCHEMAGVTFDPLNEEEAFQLFEATWLLSAWLHDDAWKDVTLDEVLLEFNGWPSIVADAVPQMRVDWAKSMVKEHEGVLTHKDVVGETDAEDKIHDVVEQGGGVVATDAPETLEDLSPGERGIHLGWFRNPPQVGVLPEGTKLVHAEGKQGLKRWVLLMEDPSGKTPGQKALTSWLASVGVPDAYEVRWDGLTWGRPEAESSPGSPTPANEADAEVEALWASGEHVDLDMLDGTWHAIQVGVFSGEPDEAWLSAVGERLVKEQLSDGRARWHVATSRDPSMAKENLDLLRSQPAFADAFLVRLEDGMRNIASSDRGSTSTPSNASGMDPEEAGEVEATVSIKTQSDDRRRDPEVPLQVALESVNTTTTSPEEQAAPTLWHVVIATYNGKVPSNEVAAFLINSAEWGVRSVELFGQTTYSSRSFVDLKDAQEMLTNIQSEGFDQARIEALY